MTVKFECIELSRLVNNLMFCDLCHRYKIRGNGFGIRDWIWLHLILFVHKFTSCDMFMCSLRCVCARKDSVHIPATITYQIYVELIIQQFPWISVSSIYSTDSRHTIYSTCKLFEKKSPKNAQIMLVANIVAGFFGSFRQMTQSKMVFRSLGKNRIYSILCIYGGLVVRACMDVHLLWMLDKCLGDISWLCIRRHYCNLGERITCHIMA